MQCCDAGSADVSACVRAWRLAIAAVKYDAGLARGMGGRLTCESESRRTHYSSDSSLQLPSPRRASVLDARRVVRPPH